MSEITITNPITKKPQKFSYSKLNTYNSCGWKYKLTYEDNHFIFFDSLASELGTLLHSIEEQIFKTLKAKEAVDYDKLKDYFYNANIPKKNKFDTDGGIFGINILKEKYHDEFYKTDAVGQSYYTKTLDYYNYGIYRLEKYLKDNPNLEPFEAEKFFSFTYKGNLLSGYIDRIFYDKQNDSYIIEDIKTKGKPFKDDELTTPLQFVIYVLGLHECLDIPIEKMSCAYDLPIISMKQNAGTRGFMTRGIKKLDQLFDGIQGKDWKPSPSPLCAWCVYSPTSENQPEEAKNLCPYYSLWTQTNRVRDQVSHKWRGAQYIEQDLQDEICKNSAKVINGSDQFDFDF